MSPQDLAAAQRRLSNVGHWAEGGLFAAVGLIALLQALGWTGGAARYASPVLLILAGVFLPVLLFGHSHGTAGHSREIARDPQQRQHLVMAALILVAGIAELALAAGWLAMRPVIYVWPAALVVIGIMFMLHTQHGDHAAMARAVRFHRLLGAAIVLAGGASAAQRAAGDLTGALAFAAPLLLLVVAGLLVTYREPSGAYEAGGEARGHGGHAA